MSLPTLPGVALATPTDLRLPSPEALALSPSALGLGSWTVENKGGVLRAYISRAVTSVIVRVSPFRRRGNYALEVSFTVIGPGFSGCGLGYSPGGVGLTRVLPPIPWTDAAAGDVLRSLERFNLPAVVAALEVL